MAMDKAIVVILFAAALVLGPTGCDRAGPGRGTSFRQRRRHRQKTPASAAARTRSSVPNTGVPTVAKAEASARDAEGTATELGRSMKTLGGLCAEAAKTRKALLTRDYSSEVAQNGRRGRPVVIDTRDLREAPGLRECARPPNAQTTTRTRRGDINRTDAGALRGLRHRAQPNGGHAGGRARPTSAGRRNRDDHQ